MIDIKRNEAFDRAPDALLLDLDNTLYAYEPAHLAGMEAVRTKARQLFHLEPERFQQVFDAARADVKTRLQGTAASHSRLLYFQRTFEMLGLKAQVLHALEFEQIYWRTFLSAAQLFEGVGEFLDDVRLAGIPTAVVTDLTAQIQFRKLVYFGLDAFFDYVVTSEEAGADKPSAAPFDLALSKLQPRGDRIWFIGDHPTSDLGGARSALRAVTLQKVHTGVERHADGNLADAIFSEFAELRGLLARTLGAPGQDSSQKRVRGGG